MPTMYGFSYYSVFFARYSLSLTIQNIDIWRGKNCVILKFRPINKKWYMFQYQLFEALNVYSMLVHLSSSEQCWIRLYNEWSLRQTDEVCEKRAEILFKISPIIHWWSQHILDPWINSSFAGNMLNFPSAYHAVVLEISKLRYSGRFLS